jgi:hypothetical protein
MMVTERDAPTCPHFVATHTVRVRGEIMVLIIIRTG